MFRYLCFAGEVDLVEGKILQDGLVTLRHTEVCRSSQIGVTCRVVLKAR